MGVKSSTIIEMLVAFILIGALLPLGLDSLFAMVLPEGIDPVIETLLQVILPILAILGVVLGFIPKMKSE